MKKMTSWSLVLASLLVVAAGCAEHKTTITATPTPTAAADSAAKPATQSRATAYTCPMHPEVVADHPGKCPKCGMDLVVKK